MSAVLDAATPPTALRKTSSYNPVLRRQKYLKSKGLLGETSPPKTPLTKKEYDRQRYLAKKHSNATASLMAAYGSPAPHMLFPSPSFPTALAVPVAMAQPLDVAWPNWSPPCNGEPAQARLYEPEPDESVPETDMPRQQGADLLAVCEQAASESEMADELAATATPPQPKTKYLRLLARMKRMAARQYRQALVLMPAFLRKEREAHAMLIEKEWEWRQTPFYQMQREWERSHSKKRWS